MSPRNPEVFQLVLFCCLFVLLTVCQICRIDGVGISSQEGETSSHVCLVLYPHTLDSRAGPPVGTAQECDTKNLDATPRRTFWVFL